MLVEKFKGTRKKKIGGLTLPVLIYLNVIRERGHVIGADSLAQPVQ